jgi:hypothetical protein
MMKSRAHRRNVDAMSTIALLALIVAMGLAAGIVLVGTPVENRATHLAYVGIVSMLTIFIVTLD